MIITSGICWANFKLFKTSVIWVLEEKCVRFKKYTDEMMAQTSLTYTSKKVRRISKKRTTAR